MLACVHSSGKSNIKMTTVTTRFGQCRCMHSWQRQTSKRDRKTDWQIGITLLPLSSYLLHLASSVMTDLAHYKHSRNRPHKSFVIFLLPAAFSRISWEIVFHISLQNYNRTLISSRCSFCLKNQQMAVSMISAWRKHYQRALGEKNLCSAVIIM